MTFKEAKEKAKEYREQIEYHNKKYYEDDNPEIDDYEYDMMVKALEKLEAQFPELLSQNSPTQNVGGKASVKFSAVEHKVKMESLHDAFSLQEIIDFDRRVRAAVENPVYVVEPKIDGLSVSLEYKNGTLVRASTRGDGAVGEDITENILTIKNLPKSITPGVEFLEVRGEVYMSKEKFLSLTKEQELNGVPPFKNPRNAAAGSLRQKDSSVTAKRGLNIFMFNVQQIKGQQLKSHKQSLDFLKSLGFPVIAFYSRYENIDDVIAEINRIGEIKLDLPFQTDGAVVKIDSFEQRKILGSTSKFPRWAEAFKYPPEEKETQVLNIEINVGRTGVLTPVGVLHPVFISGSTVSRVVLHNSDFIAEKNICIGDTVAVRKAGEIIPEVVRVVNHSEKMVPFSFPKICPSCGSEVKKIDDEVAIRCMNTDCPAQLLQNIIHFVSKSAMDIDGLGETLITKMVKNKLISSAADIYDITHESLLKMERMGEKSSQNILDSINKSKNKNLDKLICALGIRHIGQKAAKLIAVRFKSMNGVLGATKEEISAVPGLGKIAAESIFDYFSVSQNIVLIERFKKSGLNMIYHSSSVNNKLEGAKFVLTGTLSSYTRGEATAIIESMGGLVSSSVSKNTSYVLAGFEPGSKIEKAAKLGVKVISESEFKKMINTKSATE